MYKYFCIDIRKPTFPINERVSNMEVNEKMDKLLSQRLEESIEL